MAEDEKTKKVEQILRKDAKGESQSTSADALKKIEDRTKGGKGQ